MKILEGKIALVTGAGRGIGRAIALALAGEGATVAVSARSENELNAVVAEIEAAGGKALPFVVDLEMRAAPVDLSARVEVKLGAVEILVNNAGIGSSASPRPVVDFDDVFWERTLWLNLTVPYLLCKAVVPKMLAKRWGRIINIASINSKVGSLHGAAYSASKHGLLGLSKTLALETAGTGVTVNSICPGPVKTIMNDHRVEYDAKRRGVSFTEQEKTMTPLGRRLVPEEIAPLAVYLASEGAAAVTGQAINVCGGSVMV